MAPSRISLVVPAYNEAALLPRLLGSVDAARARYGRGAEAVEVIVADNASTDATASIAAAHGCRVVRVEKRVIGAARNGGASAARGEFLTFIDADSIVHAETFNAIDAALAGDRVVGGATGVTLERWSLGLVVTYAFMLPMIYVTGMDTGVVFCRRADFELLGGYDERRAVAEDVAFLWALSKLGRSRGQKLIRLRSAKAVASTRKFDRYGDWHYFTHMTRLAVAMLANPAVRDDFVRRYWYSDRD